MKKKETIQIDISIVNPKLVIRCFSIFRLLIQLINEEHRLKLLSKIFRWLNVINTSVSFNANKNNGNNNSMKASISSCFVIDLNQSSIELFSIISDQLNSIN